MCFSLLVTRVLCDLFDMGSRRGFEGCAVESQGLLSRSRSFHVFRAAPFAYIPNKTNLWAIFIIRSGRTTVVTYSERFDLDAF